MGGRTKRARHAGVKRAGEDLFSRTVHRAEPATTEFSFLRELLYFSVHFVPHRFGPPRSAENLVGLEEAGDLDAALGQVSSRLLTRFKHAQQAVRGGTDGSKASDAAKDEMEALLLGDRAAQTEAARAALTERLQRIPGLELRTVEAGHADGETDGTRLFSALSAALADVPPERVAGAVMITDGRVHDVPADTSGLGFAAPVHALVTGFPGERDRRVVLTSAPRFGIVGQQQSVTFRVEDTGAPRGVAEVRISRDGETVERRTVRTGDAVRVQVPIPHPGQNIVEIEASPLEGELTTINNRAVVAIEQHDDRIVARFADPCYPDCNADSVLDIQDFGCFVNKFIQGCP